MPRPMRVRLLRAPGRSATWLSFIAVSLPSAVARPSARSDETMNSLALDHPHEVRDLADHAADRGRVGQRRDAADAVEPKPDQGCTLGVLAADRTADLLHAKRLAAAFGRLAHGLPMRPRRYSVAACSASTSRRRACRADTLMLRRPATERGLSWCLSASNVARTIL